MNETHHIDGQERQQSLDRDKAYISMLCELAQQGKEVVLTITGSSMAPFLIHQRDAVMLGKITSPPKRGDIVCFRRDDGSFVVHRIQKVDSSGYYLIGDGQTEMEGPVAADRLQAIVTKVRRKDRWFDSKDPTWKFFASFWLSVVPMRKMFVGAWRMMEAIRP